MNLNPRASEYRQRTVAVLPLENLNEKIFRPHYPEAPEVFRSAVENTLVGNGFQIVERREIDTLLSEMELTATGLTAPDREKLGQMLSADVLIIGNVTSYVNGAATHPVSKKLEAVRAGVNLRAVHTASGVILWTATIYRNNDSPLSYTGKAAPLAEEAVAEALAKVFP